MRSLLSRATFQARVVQAAASPAALRAALADADVATLPDPLHQWLTRLRLLYGVPFNYLVPDEAMLPPESIRFFYLDANWTAALLDGAFSIGRQPAPVAGSPSLSANLDRAVLPAVQARLGATTGHLRARLLGMAAPAGADTTVVSGFMLRSELVANYPGMTLQAYPAPGTTPEAPLAPLPILRLEQLGPTSNTLLGLVAGEVYQVIAQEAPEQLHYGFDDYHYNPAASPPLQVRKQLNSLADPKMPLPTVTDFSGCFRPGLPSGGPTPAAPSRTVRLAGLATTVVAANAVPSVDAAQLGFTMIEGAGQVQFINTVASPA